MTEKGDPEQTRWVPISALPVDLQLEVKRTRYPARRLAGSAIGPARPWMMAIGGIALGVAALHVLTVNDVGGFGSTLRAIALFGGAALVALFLSGARALGFRAAGGQQIVLGPASVVLVDTKAVRVIPAEALTLRKDEVLCGTEVIYEFDYDYDSGGSDWPSRLRSVVAKAKTDDGARAEDRYREAARRAPAMWSGAVWWSRRGTQIVALGFALGAAGFVEAGPIDRRGAQNHAEQLRLSGLLTSAAAAHVQRVRAVDAVIAAVRQATERKKRERLLRAALTGDDADARKFLEDYPTTDEARPRVRARLRELCAAKLPDKRFEAPKARLIRAAGRGVCETPSRLLYLHVSAAGAADIEVARTFMSGIALEVAALSASATPRLETITMVDPTAPGACGKERCSYVELTTRLISRTPTANYYDYDERWAIDASPIDRDGKPAANAGYHHEMTITRPR